MVEFSKQSVGIKCIEIHPTGNSDMNDERDIMQIDGVTSIYILEKNGRKLVLVQAPPGFGKTKMTSMCAQVPTRLVTFILLYSDTLENQMTKDYKDIGFDPVYISLYSKNIIRDVSNNIHENKPTVIFGSNISHINGTPTKLSQQFIDVLGKLYEKNLTNHCQVLIDEMDKQLASLTGCAMKDGGFDTNATNKQAYQNIKNRESSVNIFGFLRKYDIFTVVFSGTLHSLTTTRLPLLGYKLEDIGAVCIYPIKEMYKNHDLHYHVNLKPNNKSFNEIFPYMEEAEKSDGKIMLTFPNEQYIQVFKTWYRDKTGREMSCFVYTSKTKNKDLNLKSEIEKAKYIIGIDKLTTGFNLPSYTSSNLELHIIFRPLSDKATNPISNSPGHDLYSTQSCTMIQGICRQRTGGITVIPLYGKRAKSRLTTNSEGDRRSPDELGESPKPQLYDLLKKISDCFVKGLQLWSEFSSIGSTDTLRYAQCALIGFKVNIERKECYDDVRDTIENDCKPMEKMCGKNFIEDVLHASTGGPPIDYDFWASVFERFLDSLCDKNEDILPSVQTHPATLSPTELVVKEANVPRSSPCQTCSATLSPPSEHLQSSMVETPKGGLLPKGGSLTKLVVNEANVPRSPPCQTMKQANSSIHEPPETIDSNISILTKLQRSPSVTGEVSSANSSGSKATYRVSSEEAFCPLPETFSPLTNRLYEPVPSDKPLHHTACLTSSYIEYSRTLTGGGIGKSREVDPNVHQKLKSYPVCGLCSTEFSPINKSEIAHIHEVRHGGPYTEDNLMLLCKICHAGIDAHQILLDPEGRAWFTPLSPVNVVNVEQYCNISLDNILRRWDDAKSYINCSSDKELYRLLEERRYRYISVI